jgi:hypothetical protein
MPRPRRQSSSLVHQLRRYSDSVVASRETVGRPRTVPRLGSNQNVQMDSGFREASFEFGVPQMRTLDIPAVLRYGCIKAEASTGIRYEGRAKSTL